MCLSLSLMVRVFMFCVLCLVCVWFVCVRACVLLVLNYSILFLISDLFFQGTEIFFV